MSSVFYRGDNRAFENIKRTGFQPKEFSTRGRTPEQAIAYIQDVIIFKKFKTPGDIADYIIRFPKGDYISASFIEDGASYGANKYKITYPSNPLFFEFNADGSVGNELPSQGIMIGSKPYYVLTDADPKLSEYVIVGTRTPTQEATFFTDIPSEHISLIG